MELPQKSCEQCGTSFLVFKRHPQTRHCSLSCAASHRRRQRFAATIHERFWGKVDQSSTDGCWPWTGHRSRRGYGLVRHAGWRGGAHRLAWQLTHGPIPPGMVIMHLCDNPPCCRPSHLQLGTPQENTADMVAKGRSLSGDRNPSRRYRERMPRGDTHPSRLHPERVARGERQWQAKLTAATVQEIRARYAAGGISFPALARQHGVTTSTVFSVVARITWKHVT